MNKNLISLGLLRNGKVYRTKELAIQGLTQVATNDGVAKLARYLDKNNIIRTVVGFYADAAEMENAMILYFVMLIPTDSAAIRLSRIDMMARPVLEWIRFSTITRVISTKTTPMVKLESWGVPVIPWAPFMITLPSASIPKDKLSFMEK